MVFAMDMVSVGEEAISFINHVGGEGLAWNSADTGAKNAANHTTGNAAAGSTANSGASALANLGRRNNSALSMSYYRGKNHERERGQNRARFWHGLPPMAYGAELFCS